MPPAARQMSFLPWRSRGGIMRQSTRTATGAQVAGTGAGGLQFAAVAAGRYHSLGLTRGGRVHSWGLNDARQLGRPAVNASGVRCWAPRPVRADRAQCHAVARHPEGSRPLPACVAPRPTPHGRGTSIAWLLWRMALPSPCSSHEKLHRRHAWAAAAVHAQTSRTAAWRACRACAYLRPGATTAWRGTRAGACGRGAWTRAHRAAARTLRAGCRRTWCASGATQTHSQT